MSFLSKVFVQKRNEKGLTPNEAIMKIKETEELLNKKQEYLEKKIDLEMETAHKNAKTNKRVALNALKRKNRYLKQLQQIDGSLATLEMQRETLEGAGTNTAVLKAMKDASDTLKKTQQNMNIDQVHDIMDDIVEQQAVADELSNAISSPFGQSYDEDELELELEKLEQEALDEELLKVGSVQVNVPSPEKPIAAKENKIPAKPTRKVADDDMKELEMWAS